MDINDEDKEIIIENKVRISAALRIMMDVLTGENYGISSDDLQSITRRLAEHQMKLIKFLIKE